MNIINFTAKIKTEIVISHILTIFRKNTSDSRLSVLLNPALRGIFNLGQLATTPNFHIKHKKWFDSFYFARKFLPDYESKLCV